MTRIAEPVVGSEHAGRRWLAWAAGGLVALSCLAVAPPAKARLLELTFDDDADGTGPQDGLAELDNMETRAGQFGEGALSAELTGSATRSAFTGGRYGRAADLPGDESAVEITGFAGGSEVITLYQWVRARSTDVGVLVDVDGVLELRLVTGALVLAVDDGAGDVVLHSTDATWPTDSAFHHLALSVDRSGSQAHLSLMLDFESVLELDTPLQTPSPPIPIRLGESFDGLIDEVLLDDSAPGADALFDFDPGHCPEGYACLEEVVTMTPPSISRPVPVRFKAVYDAGVCGSFNSCPLLFDISGGSTCADDYDSPSVVGRLAGEGYIVATVDLYCEGDGDTAPYPTETAQLIAVKNHLFSNSSLAIFLEGPEYDATGCSHGAGTVSVWMLHEDDHPRRTYARSAGTDALCAWTSDQVCPAVVEYREQQIAEALGSVDYNAPQVQNLHNARVSADLLDAEIVATREYALSWGVNLSGPICRDDGSYDCNEEGLWGVSYGGRRLRDMWQWLQSEATPTGYFVADTSDDCRHCAAADSLAFECGVCFLVNGRGGMDQSCPDCLSYFDSRIDPGGAAEACRLEASWYEDPLAEMIEPVDTGGGGSDSGGCGCRVARSAHGATPLALLGLALLLRRRRRT